MSAFFILRRIIFGYYMSNYNLQAFFKNLNLKIEMEFKKNFLDSLELSELAI